MQNQYMTPKSFALFVFSTLFYISCSKDGENKRVTDPIIIEEIYNDGDVDDALKINQIQYLSSHNSYRKHTDKTIYKFLQSFSGLIPYNLVEWEYDHLPIYTQLEQYGVRHIELDIYADKEGGRFYNRAGYKWTARDEASGIEELKEPGLKILHIPDVDFETHNYTFISALREVKEWSKTRPNHLPIFIMIETKTETVGQYLSGLGFVKAEAWDEENVAAIEKEILKVFTREEILTPDEVRNGQNTLRDGLMKTGWPTVGESRGKVMFMFDQENISESYRGANKSLYGKLIFTNAKNEYEEDAAFIKRNDPFSADIENLVSQGFLVRSMIGGVYESKSGDYTKFETGKAKGVHFLSTDYYKPDDRVGKVAGWTDFHVRLENHSYRINPITK